VNASTLSTFYYEPPHLARLLTTFDVLSDGRLDVGVGLGRMKDELRLKITFKPEQARIRAEVIISPENMGSI
jgi:alkanesulfonate monooxygenase SsuD/methylene tetrahydromethanopterin reductase-like flavin-dependent oxidoreductase (luciferase family)